MFSTGRSRSTEIQLHGPPFAGLAGTTEGWIFVFCPWGSPQVGNQPHVAACGLTSAAACNCCFSCFCCSSPPPPPPSSSSKFQAIVSNHNFTDSVLKFYSFPAIAPDVQQSALFRLLCVTGQSWTVKMLWYEHLIQWQQNGSKAMIWQLYKIAAIRGCPRRFY